LIVLAPNSVQEMVDFVSLGFELADKYRNPALILSDGAIGQMMEKVNMPDPVPYKPNKPWATTGKTPDRKRNIITSLYIKSEDMEEKNAVLQKKYKEIEEAEVRFEDYRLEYAEIIITAFGLTSRICKKVVDLAREAGIKMGLLRPITLWPFPVKKVAELAATGRVKFFFSVEMNAGQMVEDIRLHVEGKKPVYFYGRSGGIVPTSDEILDFARSKL
jgi:2-oxoglutarate ferredoxin oxidoreductase subunit alpha